VDDYRSKISISKSAATFTRYRRRQLLSACGFAVFSVFYLSAAVHYELFTYTFYIAYAILCADTRGRGGLGQNQNVYHLTYL